MDGNDGLAAYFMDLFTPRAVIPSLLADGVTEYDSGRWFENDQSGEGEPFFILWNPESSLPPTVRFRRRTDAYAVAERMAQEHGGTFYVMQVDGRARRVEFIDTEQF